MEFTDDLRLAHLLADNADSISMKRFRSADLQVSIKPDLSAVTDADRAVEDAIRKLLTTARTRDAVHGEEFADTGYGSRQWIIDPIDGTANYLRGVPVWATLIALMTDGIVRVGVVSAPALGRRWWAAEGEGAFMGKTLLNSTQLQVSGVVGVSDAFLSYSELSEWVKCGRGQQFVDLLRDAGRTRGFGDFFSYMLVAEGAADIACEPQLALHDMAALDVVIREAGGTFTNLDGTPGVFGPGALATNSVLHAEILERLAVDETEDGE
jgi:histidinol-phosphatase